MKRMFAMLLVALLVNVNSADGQTWRRGQQLLIWPRPDSMYQGDTINLTAMARTSSGTPVGAPSVNWTSLPAFIVDGKKTSINTVRYIAYNVEWANATDWNGEETMHFTASWRTNSGTFVDTLSVKLRPRPTSGFPWLPNKRVAIVPSTPNTVAVGDTLVVRAYVRGSEGELYTSPPVEWSASPSNIITAEAVPDYGRVAIIGRAPGTVDLYARYITNGRRDTLRITVTSNAPPTNPYAWKRGQQLLIVPSDIILRPSDSITYNVYARTSAGLPVTNPKIDYIVRNYNDIGGGYTTPGNKTVLRAKPVMAGLETYLVARWVTRSGTFVDSVMIRSIATGTP